jgi:glycosyltransferase involved in cell wall biosynthesis
MRIAYVVLHLDKAIMDGGVGKKIGRQTKLWQESGQGTRIFILSPDDFTFCGSNSFSFLPHDGRFPKFSFFSRELSRNRALQSLIQAVKDYGPDIIYLRYGMYAFPLEKLFDIAPVVVEINTNDIDEYRYRGRIFYWMNRLFRGRILRNSEGIVVPSFELGDLPANQKYQKPITVITNGIDLTEISPLLPARNNNPVLAFVATPGYPWHGVDKIIELAGACYDLDFIVIGFELENFPGRPPANLKLLGFLGQKEIGNALLKADVAFGTLALHRKNMNEACPLKVREALAYGLPIIYAYKDTDLEDLDSEFLLRLPNTENNMIQHVDEIRAFAYKMQGKRVKRNIISSRIDQRIKEKQRLDFFEKIIGLSMS